MKTRRIWGQINYQEPARFFQDEQLTVCHVGDSRAYLFREGRLRQLTKDHTIAQEMVDLGEISSSEAVTHNLRNVLTNALGDTGKAVRPDVYRFRLRSGDVLLLCSDGLTDMVANEQIAGTLTEGGTSKEVCQRLFTRAMDGGGKDNITIVIARYEFPAG